VAAIDIYGSLFDKTQFIEHDLSDTIHTAQIFERVNPVVIVWRQRFVLERVS
jgi:hypothetical protein